MEVNAETKPAMPNPKQTSNTKVQTAIERNVKILSLKNGENARPNITPPESNTSDSGARTLWVVEVSYVKVE
jgi:hypothetical protein